MKLLVNGKNIEVNLLKVYSSGVSFEVNGKSYLVEKQASGTSQISSGTKHKSLKESNSRRADSDTVTAPISGLIISIPVKPGDKVNSGTELLILEAMKMQNKIFAERDGVVGEIFVGVGWEVSEGDAVLKFKN